MARYILKLLFISALLNSAVAIRAQNSSSPSPSSTNAASTANYSSDSSPVFADAHRLLQLGKYDEALAQLKDLEAKSPETPGLPHELGITYYRKSDYINAIAVKMR